MSFVQEVPRKAWRNSAGSFWGWVMHRNDNRLVQQIPNILTVGRLVVIPAGILSYLAFIVGDMPEAWLYLLAATAIFGLTDYLDGKAARSLKVESDFGRLADPVFDKAAAGTLFVLFLGIVNRPDFIPLPLAVLTNLLVAVILSIEAILLVTAFRNRKRHRTTPGSNKWGKKKLNAELGTLAIAYVLVYLSTYGLAHEIAPIAMSVLSIPIIFLGAKSLQGHIRTRNDTKPIPKRP
jgi:phosphatidylglycerophosphate synthase